MIRTARTVLRRWTEADRPAFAAMHADAEVMWDTAGPLSRPQSDEKMDRYRAAFQTWRFCRWAVEDLSGTFIGYAGVMAIPADYPVAPGFEIGWRFVRSAWGKGLAAEAAAAALHDVFARTELAEVLSYTAPDNIRSQAVMQRLQLTRVPRRDFTLPSERQWQGLVWSADRSWRLPQSGSA
jgi:RimJ/RimL family protein N-acetyltransferase